MKDDPRNHTNGHEQEVTNEKMIDGKSSLSVFTVTKKRTGRSASPKSKRDEGAPPLFVPLCDDPTYRSPFRAVEGSWTSFCERHASLVGSRECRRSSPFGPAASP